MWREDLPPSYGGVDGLVLASVIWLPLEYLKRGPAPRVRPGESGCSFAL